AGGNAFDAAIAALWAACIAEPVLASPGGGGFLMAHSAQGETRIHDFFAHTPRRRRDPASLDFHNITVNFGAARQDFHVGHGAAACPGFVRGLFAAHRAHGSMPMSELCAPAVAAAREGVPLTDYQAYLLRVVGPIYLLSASARSVFARPSAGAPVTLGAGERLRNPALADVLEALGREGDRLFYEGELAATIARSCDESGGHLTREDLTRYQAFDRAPLRRSYRGASLCLNAPPSSGGILIAFTLAMLEDGPLRAHARSSAAHLERVAQAMLATNRLRAQVGETIDPSLLDPALLARYRKEVLPAPPATRGTTHISVIDAAGNAATATVSNGEGCGHMVPGAGFMLNNMLGEEDINPRGLGAWLPDQRMSSMMAPTIVTLPDGGFCALGSGGSNRIRSAVLQVLVNLIDYDLDPREAVEAPRIHLERAHLDFEALLETDVCDHLARRFPDHHAWPERNMFYGGVHTAMRTARGELIGAGDPRRAGVCLAV
ncbi:MAG: gamma-glutamyltransferase, partial [Myxococcales bacterium]|nr:gamma-glutamyltransferase [Myxococcales bacterium]